MHVKKFKQVTKLSSEERYSYSIRKIADFEELWVLKTDEGWTMISDSNTNVFPVWPEKEFAQGYCRETLQNCYADKIDLNEFLEKWLPGLVNDDVQIVVFPVEDFKGVVVTTNKFKRDLLEESAQYE